MPTATDTPSPTPTPTTTAMPRISFYGNSRHRLSYLSWVSPTWSLQEATRSGGEESCLVLDGEDKPYVSYRQAYDSDGELDRPHLAYTDDVVGGLMYAVAAP